MKKRNSSVFGLIAFVFGTLIIVLAYILLMPLFSFNPVAYTFSFVSILLTYIFVFPADVFSARSQAMSQALFSEERFIIVG